MLVVSLRRPVEGVVRRLEGDHQEQRPAGVTTLDSLHRLLGEHLGGEQACRGQNTDIPAPWNIVCTFIIMCNVVIVVEIISSFQLSPFVTFILL